jgi:hypothetical protein
MIRLATTYLLILVVLSCPYQCLGEAVCEAHAPGQKSGCCCKDQDQSPGDKTPQSPNERDEDCLCHGAILDGSRMADDELTSPVAMTWVLEDTSPAIDPSLLAVTFESPQQFPPFSTGRDVCALTCTLQL